MKKYVNKYKDKKGVLQPNILYSIANSVVNSFHDIPYDNREDLIQVAVTRLIIDFRSTWGRRKKPIRKYLYLRAREAVQNYLANNNHTIQLDEYMDKEYTDTNLTNLEEREERDKAPEVLKQTFIDAGLTEIEILAMAVHEGLFGETKRAGTTKYLISAQTKLNNYTKMRLKEK